MPDFLQKLEQAITHHHIRLCTGLDPDPARLPIPNVTEFNRAIINATQDLVCAYKPNLAFYEALGKTGRQALAATVDYRRQAAPHALIIGDAKRGDGGPSAAACARHIPGLGL